MKGFLIGLAILVFMILSCDEQESTGRVLFIDDKGQGDNFTELQESPVVWPTTVLEIK